MDDVLLSEVKEKTGVFPILEAICLPKLNNLTPTLPSTLLKAVEEAGELARAVLIFLPREQDREAPQKYGVNIPELVSRHILKLQRKGYCCLKTVADAVSNCKSLF